MSIKDDRVDLVIADGASAVGPDQRILWELATRLSPARYRLQMWIAASSGMDPLAEAIAARDIEVERLPLGEGWRGALGLWLKLSRRRPTLLHLHQALGAGRRWAAAIGELCRDARVVLTQTALEPADSPTDRLLERRLAARAEAFLVPTQAIADRLVRDLGVARDRVRNLPAGIDPPEEEHEMELGARARRALGAGLFRPLWLCPDPLEPGHGHEVLLQALVRVRDAGLPFLAVWSGAGSERIALEKRALELGLADRARFDGAAHGARDLMAAADLVVCPAPGGHRAHAMLEAMARGRTIVAGACGIASELIENGITGRLAPVDDAAELSGALEWAARNSDAARRMGAAAAYRAGDEHGWPRVIESLEAAYDDLLGLATFAPEGVQASPSRR